MAWCTSAVVAMTVAVLLPAVICCGLRVNLEARVGLHLDPLTWRFLTLHTAKASGTFVYSAAHWKSVKLDVFIPTFGER